MSVDGHESGLATAHKGVVGDLRIQLPGTACFGVLWAPAGRRGSMPARGGRQAFSLPAWSFRKLLAAESQC